jgi:hypothetical protein
MLRNLISSLALAAMLHFSASADVIGPGDFIAIPDGAVIIGSGNGRLELRMLTHSGSEVDNERTQPPPLNLDNGNSTLPHNNGVNSFAESYVTTAGEIQQFYILNFPDGMGGSTVTELVLMLDLAENSGTEAINTSLDVLDIVLNPATINGNPDPAGDVTSVEQAAIDHIYTGGALIANLASAITTPTVASGQGHADYAFYTGINPFILAAGDRLLFNVTMSGLSNGSEEVFISPDFSGADIIMSIPESSASRLMGFACAVVCTGALMIRRTGLFQRQSP